MGEPWDRQPGETDKAYAAFGAYLALGPWRSQRALCDQIYGGKISGLRTIEGWSGRNLWVDRARSWDAAQAVKIREELAAQRLDLARQVMRNAADLNAQLDPSDLRGVSAYTKMALDASRTETGLPQSVGEVRLAGHDGGPLPTPDLLKVPLAAYAEAAAEVAGEDD
jgi:hypothetical protein